MALRVKMNPIKEVLNGVSQTTGMKIALTTLTAGPTKATTSPQDAQIEFYEMDAKSGESKGQRLFATLKFKLSLSASGQPKLDGENKTPSSLVYETFLRSDHVKHPTGYFPPDRSGDFFLDLELPDQADNFFNVSRLYIPWEVESDHVAEIGARLLVAGSEEASPLANGIFTVPLDHKNVPENGKSGGLKIDHVGVGVVYPTDSSLWAPGVYGGAKKASKAPASAFNIYLHDQILDEFSKPPNRKVVLADVEARLIDVFSDTDLPKPTIALKTDADLKAKGFEGCISSCGMTS